MRSGNQVLVCSVAGWTVAQVLKTIIDVVLNRSFNPERLFGLCGMPSSHSATVCALTTASGLKYGVGSFEFAIKLVVAMVVMYDAMGVRRETGKQAQLLNSVFFEKYTEPGRSPAQEKLKEYVGHTPLQVVAWRSRGIGIHLVISSFHQDLQKNRSEKSISHIFWRKNRSGYCNIWQYPL